MDSGEAQSIAEIRRVLLATTYEVKWLLLTMLAVRDV